MLHIFDKCPICDLNLKNYSSTKDRYICYSDEKHHVFYLETNKNNSITNIYTIVNKFCIDWNFFKEKSLSVYVPITEVKLVKYNLLYFEPNLNSLKDEIFSILERFDKIKLFI